MGVMDPQLGESALERLAYRNNPSADYVLHP